MPSPSGQPNGEEIVEAQISRVAAELNSEATQTLEVDGADPKQTYISEEVEVRVRNLLGIKRENWDRIMPQVRELLPRYALYKITARLSLNMGFDSIGQLAQTIEIGKKIMESQEEDVSRKSRCRLERWCHRRSRQWARCFPSCSSSRMQGETEQRKMKRPRHGQETYRPS